MYSHEVQSILDQIELQQTRANQRNQATPSNRTTSQTIDA